MFQFPASPIVGDLFTPVAGVTFRWNGVAWFLISTQYFTQADGDARYQQLSGTGVANGYASLDAAGKVPATQLWVRGYLWGLTLSNNAGDAVNDIDIAAGEASADDGSAVMALAAALTKRSDAAWAVGTNQGGLDTGAIG